MENNLDIAEPIKFKVIKEQVATMIINGVSQGIQEVESVVMICPHCGNVLTKMNANTPLIDVYKAFGDMEDTSRFLKYCPECGKRLSYDKRIVSIQEGKFIIDEESIAE